MWRKAIGPNSKEMVASYVGNGYINCELGPIIKSRGETR